MDQTNRKTDLESIFEGVDPSVKVIVTPLIEDVAFLEAKLKELRMLPTIQVHPTNPAKQKLTVSGKQYKEYLQQYSNCIKILCSVLNKNEIEEESPLRQYLNSLKGKYEK